MKIKNIIGILTLLVMVSCVKEDDIVVRKSEIASKFEFPQGNNEWDKKLAEINDKFGVKCIYKDITPEDLNKAWSGIGAVGDFGVKGEGIEDESLVKFYTDFFLNHIFGYFDPTITEGIFPPNIYLVYDYHERVVNPFFGNAGFPNAKEYYDKKLERIYTGLDFWAFCFEGSERHNAQGALVSFLRPTVALSFVKCKEPIVKTIIDKLINKGKIKEPKFLSQDQATDLDYKTPILTANSDIAKENYFKNRGFVELYRSITTYSSATNPTNSGSGVNQKVNMTPSLLFVDYIWLGVRFTKADILKNYAAFPKVIKYYGLVEEYLRTNYNLNLDDIAQQPIL